MSSLNTSDNTTSSNNTLNNTTLNNTTLNNTTLNNTSLAPFNPVATAVPSSAYITEATLLPYTLCANFNREIANQIVDARSTTWESCPELISSVSMEHPRMAILDGPNMELEKKEITTFDKLAVENLYPGLLTSNFKLPFFYIYRGVSHFKRGNRYIIKMEFASQVLTNLQMTLRRALPSVDIQYAIDESHNNDKSKARQPERWLYVPICEVTEEKHIIVVEEAARRALQYFPPLVAAAGLSIISAITQTVIQLPFTPYTTFKPQTQGHMAVHISDVLEVTNDELSIGLYNMDLQTTQASSVNTANQTFRRTSDIEQRINNSHNFQRIEDSQHTGSQPYTRQIRDVDQRANQRNTQRPHTHRYEDNEDFFDED